jgi:hypothetical protein
MATPRTVVGTEEEESLRDREAAPPLSRRLSGRTRKREDATPRNRNRKKKRKELQHLIAQYERTDSVEVREAIFEAIIAFVKQQTEPLSEEEYNELEVMFPAQKDRIAREQKKLKELLDANAIQLEIVQKAMEGKHGFEMETAKEQVKALQRKNNELQLELNKLRKEIAMLKQHEKTLAKTHKEQVSEVKQRMENIMNERVTLQKDLEKIASNLGDQFLNELYWVTPEDATMRETIDQFPFITHMKKMQSRYSALNAEYKALEAELNATPNLDEEIPIMRRMKELALDMDNINKFFIHTRNNAVEWMRKAVEKEHKELNKEFKDMMEIEGVIQEYSREQIDDLEKKRDLLLKRQQELRKQHLSLVDEFEPNFPALNLDDTASLDKTREETAKWVEMVTKQREQLRNDLEETGELITKADKAIAKAKEGFDARIQRLEETRAQLERQLEERLKNIVTKMDDIDAPEKKYEDQLAEYNRLDSEKEKLQALLGDLDAERLKLGASPDDALLEKITNVQKQLEQKYIEIEAKQQEVTQAKEDFDQHNAAVKKELAERYRAAVDSLDLVPSTTVIEMLGPKQARDRALKDLETARVELAKQEAIIRQADKDFPLDQAGQDKLRDEIQTYEGMVAQYNQRVTFYRESETILRTFVETAHKAFLTDLDGLEKQIDKALTQEYDPHDENSTYIAYDWNALIALYNKLIPLHLKTKNKVPPTDQEVVELAQHIRTFDAIKEDAKELPNDMATIQQDVNGPRKAALAKISDDAMVKDVKKELEKQRRGLGQKLRTILEGGRVEAHMEVYDKGLGLLEWRDIQLRLRKKFMAMQKEMLTDKSTYFPALSKMLSGILSDFTTKAQGFTPTEEQEFKEMLKENLTEALKQTGQVSKLLQALEEQRLKPAASYEALRDYILDPMSFSEADRQRDFMHSKMGMTLANSRTLLALVQNTIMLRQQYLRKIYPAMNITEARDAHLFDMVFTHCFPPTSIGSRLRLLRALSPEDRTAYKTKPFLKALTMLDESFDVDRLTDENFELRLATMVQKVESYLQNLCLRSGVGYETMLHDAEQIERTKYMIYTQLDPDVDDPEREGMENEMRQADGVPITDEDAGALMQANGQRVSTTWNPSTQNQITRDQIDDVKKQTYEREVGKFLMWTMDGGEDEPYVPMHTRAAKYYFGAPNYENLKKKFDSMRPLLPKESVKNPSHEIEKILGLYGPILGVKGRITSDKDHPVMIQQEVMELQELVKAYSEYTVTSEPYYNHTPYHERQKEAEPERSQDVPSGGSFGGNIKPESANDEEQDALTKGLFQDYSAYYKQMESEQQRSGFKNQTWLSDMWKE